MSKGTSSDTELADDARSSLPVVILRASAASSDAVIAEDSIEGHGW
jgi:hypothetical protein